MKKVNFKELKVETSIGKYEPLDIREGVGNLLHNRSSTIPMSDLARKIFHSQGSVEIEDKLFDEMMAILDEVALMVLRQAIRNEIITTQEY